MVFWRFIRKWWWLFLVGIGLIFVVAWRLLKPTNMQEDEMPEVPQFLEMAREKVEKVHLEGEVQKAKVRATAEAQVEEIKRIEEKGKEDPVQARKDLANLLARTL